MITQNTNLSLKTSEEWYKTALYILKDPDGWDRKNFHYSWFEELITCEEFQRRLMLSTITGIKKK